MSEEEFHNNNEHGDSGSVEDGLSPSSTTPLTSMPPLTSPPLATPPPLGPTRTAAPAKRKSVGKTVGVALGVVGLLGGAAFAASQFTGGEKANTPEEAVESFLRSVETKDAIGMAKLLAPSERDVMLDSLVPLVAELSRLEIVDKNLDLTKVPGYEAKVTGFRATSTLLRPDLAEVRITGGKVATSVDLKKLPIGAFVKDIVGNSIDDAKVESSTSDIKMASDDGPLVVQKVGKRWYISLSYTLAETSRRDSATPFAVPPKGGGIAAKGAETPEEAVSQMLIAAGRLDVRRMLELVPPDEFGALQEYSTLFIEDAERRAAEGRKVAQVEITPKLASTPVTGDRALVTITDLPFTVKASSDGFKLSGTYANKTLRGEFTTDQGETITADYRGECLTLVVDRENKKGCAQKGITQLLSDITGQDLDAVGLGSSGLGLNLGTSCNGVKQAKPKLGFIAVKRDGKWFVSPNRTWFDGITAVLKGIDRKNLDCVKKQIEDVVNTITGNAAPGGTDPTFEAPTDSSTDPFSPSDSSEGDSSLDEIGDTLPLSESLPAEDTLVFSPSTG